MTASFLQISRTVRHWVYLVVIMTVAGGGGFLPNAVQAQPTTNLALHQPTTVGSATADHPGTFAVDGDDHTYWQSKKNADRSFFTIHLKEKRPIDRVLLPRSAGFDSLTVQVWRDGAWDEAFRGSTEAQVLFGFDPVMTSKVRLLPQGNEEIRLYEVKVFAHSPQPVFVNQSGYNLHWPKRFTAPEADDKATFYITRDGSSKKLYRGIISGQIGDFTNFRPEDPGPYMMTVIGEKGTGTSVPFNVGPYWMERASYEPAINFMIDSRCWWGDSRNYAPTDENADCPSRGVAWRDGVQYSFEVPTLIEMYFANPSAFGTDRMPVQGPYLGLREELPEDTPEIVRLIYWGVDIFLRGQVDHALLKEQLAYFAHAYPHLAEYIPRNVYEEAREYLFEHWGDPEFERWEDVDFDFGSYWSVDHTANLFQTYTQIGTGKGQFPPGHSVIPNLMMYEVAEREGRSDAEQFFGAARAQTEWIIENLNWENPRTTKGQRMSEHITVKGLVYFLENYPERAPQGLKEKIERWAEVMIRRSDNMWDFRRYSDDRWIIPNIRPPDHPSHATDTGFNEPGNVAGFPAPALAAARVVENQEIKYRLRQIAMAHLDNVFGRNPTGRHFSYDAETDFEGVEQGWFKEYQGGAGQLQSARGVLDGSPKETTYPYDPYAGDPGHTEGWVTFNTAWNAALAFLSTADVEVMTMGPNFQFSKSSVGAGQTAGIRLEAPLNFDYDELEKGTVQVKVNGEARRDLEVTEASANSRFFRTTITIQPEQASTSLEDHRTIHARPGDIVTVSYGYGTFKKTKKIRVTE